MGWYSVYLDCIEHDLCRRLNRDEAAIVRDEVEKVKEPMPPSWHFHNYKTVMEILKGRNDG